MTTAIPLSACPDCGERLSQSMRLCPASKFALGYHHLPEKMRWLGLAPIVPASTLFAALDRQYDAMWRARAKKVAA